MNSLQKSQTVAGLHPSNNSPFQSVSRKLLNIPTPFYHVPFQGKRGGTSQQKLLKASEDAILTEVNTAKQLIASIEEKTDIDLNTQVNLKRKQEKIAPQLDRIKQCRRTIFQK